MKINEQWTYDHSEDRLIQKKTYTSDPYVKLAKDMRDFNGGRVGESVCVGIIPMHILGEWFKEAGVSWDDKQACGDVVKRKMLSGEFDKLRVWEGNY